MHQQMTRRDLLKIGATAVTTAGLGGTPAVVAADERTANGDTTAWKPGDPIAYINRKAPDVGLPSYRGERYEATVPDTLEIAERARLAVNALTEPTDPLADYEYYCGISLLTNPP